MRIEIRSEPIDAARLARELANPTCGALATFEGWARNHHEGRSVDRLEYEVYHKLALSEGRTIIEEARARFPFTDAICVHREGVVEIGGVAVFVGVVSPHRAEAFDACRYIIDEVKARLPIWKKEHYSNGEAAWVNCQRCAQSDAAVHQHGHGETRE